MTDISSIALKPTIKLRGGEFILEIDPPNGIVPSSCGLRVTCHDHNDFVIECIAQPDTNGRLAVAFPIQSVRIPWLTKVHLALDEDTFDISDLFLRYQLDREKLKDNVYLTNNLFNAAARNYSHDDLFVVAYAYLNVLPLENQNFGGLITILCYRIGDKLDERANIIEIVNVTYRYYVEKVSIHNAAAFRWFVSSSSVLATILLSIGSITQASNVVDTALKTIVHPSFNPMVHQNYTLLLFQGGLIKAWYGHFDEAASLFIGAVNAGRYGMIDLLHPQNSWVLGQMSDCRKFLHIIEASYNAALACTRNKLPPESRFAPVKASSKLQINFQTIFERFEFCKKSTPPFFMQALQKMQAHQDHH
ncbi:MAG: hypothetical protein CTY16_09810 [Methylobacter sp.]|uniref:hypothetical protein n=1 Tax=Methylovulum miyakonense TaxID=645578 RepID=UPI000363AE1A|nr:hypothetical protein [Methylovulum miyakonense]PPD45687.1 MAG: hypothetical protein CTY16_09810 [Methylobacter sp.]